MDKSVVKIPVFEKPLDECLALLISVLPDEQPLANGTILEKLIHMEKLSLAFFRRYGGAGVKHNGEFMSACGTNNAGVLFEPTSLLLELVTTLGTGEGHQLLMHARESITSGRSK